MTLRRASMACQVYVLLACTWTRVAASAWLLEMLYSRGCSCRSAASTCKVQGASLENLATTAEASSITSGSREVLPQQLQRKHRT